MVDLFHMHPCAKVDTDFCASFQQNHHGNVHIHHHSTNGDRVDVKLDQHGGHTEIVQHADGTKETIIYNSKDDIMAIQMKDGHWVGFGRTVPDSVKHHNHHHDNHHIVPDSVNHHHHWNTHIAPESGVRW